jgi:integrase
MPRTANRLTAREVAAAKFEGADRKVSDGGGLYLLVKESGKYWRLKFRFDGREKVLALGVYPEVSLSAARKAAQTARENLGQGIDPVAKKKASKAARRDVLANSVEAIGREWHEAVHDARVVPAHATRNLRRLESYLFPKLGTRPIAEVSAPELLEVLREIERTGKHETVHRVKVLCGQVWRYAISTGRADRDIAADLKNTLKPSKVQHHAAITDPEELGGLLRAIDAYAGFPAAAAALKLAPLLFCRPGELRHMEWADVDLDDATWDYKPGKGGGAMITPLPRQAVEILRALEPVTGGGRFVFPSVRGDGRPMSENTLTAALARMGYADRQSAHGFRATARTLIVERLGYPENVVEMQLAHAVRDANGRAYNRTTLLDQRREMLQAWADYLDSLKSLT